MLPGSKIPYQITDGEQLARTREQFLTAEDVDPNQVRDAILASWWRSRRFNVAADHVDLSYVRDPDLDTPLTRSALPVLRHLREHLDGQPISIILTDPQGLVLTRMDAGRDLDAHLDRVNLAPGFSYAEEYVGTNGIGTALEGGRPMHVFGHEHYAEHLEDLACAGVPIHHPISGKTIGAVDLTCWRKDADPLLLTLAKTTAGQIQQALLTESGIRELELLQEYLRTCRRTAGIVFALNNDVVMMNDHARQVLDPTEQSVLLAQAAETLASRAPTASVVVELPSGVRARLYCRPVRGEGRLAGGVVHVKLTEPGARPRPETAPRMFLPGLVGSGALWLRGCHQVQSGYDAGEWLAVEGEPGVGKLAVVRAVHQHRRPGVHFAVLDGAAAGRRGWLADARRELLTGPGTVVIRHVDRLSSGRSRALARLLDEARAAAPAPWVAVTLSQRRDAGEMAGLLRFFPRTVELPPLRHHVEDVQALVPFFLSRLVNGGNLTCSPEAMQLLVRSSWPGNTEQLYQVLRRVVQHRRSGAIRPADLPPECRTVSRRLLSPLEAMERDAIVRSLIDWDGNKIKAAGSLGMSRATIYRKIHEYGIVTPVT
ncbi:sigma-54-dependent Fis family transcriptional regulator [Asanoa iriomotensis]|uniref:Fis family transcriptional regulator n=1 Tax=Asanoa iriomotensis TaxID=234613 RepID=A0ABQ4BYH4_9ACTN|nr:GAF domain-containing protein [Asanoa iriomotensis]GIF55583.1 Fis family transcriptional regulator [Asanoa iriomotensis]